MNCWKCWKLWSCGNCGRVVPIGLTNTNHIFLSPFSEPKKRETFFSLSFFILSNSW
nr:MAG TPA: hypothetical protein [Caudoviricetes sp.]